MYNTILNRLRNGEQSIDIANEIADILNQAVADYEAEVEAARKAAAAEADRKNAIAGLTNAFNSFFGLFPGAFGDEPVTEDVVENIMNMFTGAFNTGYTIHSRSEAGKKPEIKVTVHGSDDKIAKFLKDHNLK